MVETAAPAPSADRHGTSLDRTLKELQRTVREHEDALNKVGFNRSPPLAALRALKVDSFEKHPCSSPWDPYRPPRLRWTS